MITSRAYCKYVHDGLAKWHACLLTQQRQTADMSKHALSMLNANLVNDSTYSASLGQCLMPGLATYSAGLLTCQDSC